MRSNIFRTALFSLFIAISASAQTEIEAVIETPRDPAAEAKRVELMRATTFGEKYFALGDYASALEQYSRADEMLPNHPAVLFNTALVLSRLGRLAEAQSKIDLYLKLYPSGEEIEKVQKLRIDLEFERELQKKQQDNQSYVELFNRAKFTYENGDPQSALKLFEEAAQQRPEDAAAVFNQAVVFEALGEYAQATERLRKYQAIAPAADKGPVDERIFALEREIEDQRESHVCPFCGFKLSKTSPWCPRCWHGPYDASAARFSTRPCGTGASATRTVLYPSERVHQNEDLPCNLSGNLREALRFSSARQRAIQQTRREEGWTYNGNGLASYSARDANVLRLVHGTSLEKVINLSTGDVLTYSGRSSGDKWLLEREQVSIDGQKFDKSYSYDDDGRIASEVVRYQNGSACGHLIQTTATYHYAGPRLENVSFVSGYTGFQIEGIPQVEWKGTMRFLYDEHGRVSREEFVVDSHTKTWGKKPFGPLRDQVKNIYSTMRVKKPLDILKIGDVCTTAGARLVGNQVDLRPFYTISPDLAVLLPLRTSKVAVALTYPAGFTVEDAGR